MKKILLCLSVVLTIVACKEEPPKDYVTFSGKIENKNSDSLFVYQGRGFSKTINVNEDGTFTDTLKVTTGMYSIYDGNKSSSLYLKNNYELYMTLDNTKEFDKSIKFSGNGAESNNYLVEKTIMVKNLISPSIFDLEESDFNAKIVAIDKEMNAFLDKNSKVLDSTLLVNEKMQITQFKPDITRAYKQQKARVTQFSSFVGKPSPDFSNYENFKGGKTSLADLKGKYVYIDLWATWCGPCLKEIPSLKEVEKEFHGKNIEFVSISVDNGRGYKAATPEESLKLAHEGWKKMVVDKDLVGMQLFADNGFNSSFVQGYKVNGIPRFILIDPAGNVINADAPRPSSPKLKTVLNGLKNI